MGLCSIHNEEPGWKDVLEWVGIVKMERKQGTKIKVAARE